MSLPDSRAAPEELFETFAEESPEEVMALADAEPESTPDEVGTARFDRFVDGISVEPDRDATDDDPGDPGDLDELFG